ncbi:MAG: type IV secretory system conjugative DNA transfer family protein [Tepidisphaeraceae bacterium]
MTRAILILLRFLTHALAAYCILIGMLLMWPQSGLLLLLVAGLAWRFRKRARPDDLGSARFAEYSELKQAGMIGASRGLILGRLPKPLRSGIFGKSPLIRLPNAVHTCVIGPTGSGKGVSFVIPTLLTDSRSCVVLDFKGELYKATAEHRRRYFGQRIALLDPYRVIAHRTPDSFNPLSFIPKEHPLGIDDINDLAAALVVRTGREPEQFWNDCSEACIAAITAVVVAHGGEDSRSLQNVREILSHPTTFNMAVQLGIDSPAWDGALARMAGQLLHLTDKERASVLSSTLRHLKFLGSPPIMACTSTSTFDPAELREGKLTVYCVLPPDRVAAQSGLLRMWVSSLLRACYRGGLQ